jgi:hypothetical protein
MAGRKWRGIRPGAKRLNVYNEGGLVYIFDQGSLPALAASGADFQSGFADEESEVDPTLRKLAREGLFLAYELQQDDPVAVEVVVGPPLTTKELAVGRWHKPQRAFLRLPSGKLVVHTPNTLPIHDKPTDKPGRATVPPGNYVATLYRIDWDELRNDGIVIDDEETGEERLWEGPEEVIVLTPAADAKPVRGARSYLRFPQKSTSVWKGKYEISGQTLRGKAMFPYWWEDFFVNIDRPAAAALGLAPGTSFRVEVADFTIDAVYAGEALPQDMIYNAWAKPLAGDRPEFGVAYRPTNDEENSHSLHVLRVVAARPFPTHERWMPATVTVLPEHHPVAAAPNWTPISVVPQDTLPADARVIKPTKQLASGSGGGNHPFRSANGFIMRQEELARLWDLLPKPAAPDVDFHREVVVVVTAEKKGIQGVFLAEKTLVLRGARLAGYMDVAAQFAKKHVEGYAYRVVAFEREGIKSLDSHPVALGWQG